MALELTNRADRPAGASELDPVLVHIGYHRTGTTWLQTSLFRDESAGFRAPHDKATDILPALIAPHALDFDAAACQARLYPLLLEAQGSGLVPVVSSERLVGSPHFGGRDSKELADRVKAVFPSARVLVGIREQREVILSNYKSYVNAGGASTVADYLQPPVKGGGVPRFDLAHFEYDRLVGYYQRLFGAERVIVSPLEEMVRDQTATIRRITRLCSTGGHEMPASSATAGKRNAGLPGVAVPVKRLLNPIFARDRLNPSPLVPLTDGDARLRRFSRKVASRAPERWSRAIDGRLMDQVVAIVGDRYQASNARLREMTGVPLERFGYEV